MLKPNIVWACCSSTVWASRRTSQRRWSGIGKSPMEEMSMRRLTSIEWRSIGIKRGQVCYFNKSINESKMERACFWTVLLSMKTCETIHVELWSRTQQPQTPLCCRFYFRFFRPTGYRCCQKGALVFVQTWPMATPMHTFSSI